MEPAYRCRDCGHGIHEPALEPCPNCGGKVWEDQATREAREREERAAQDA